MSFDGILDLYYTVDIWPPLLAAGVLAALSLYSWQRREVVGARLLAIAWLLSSMWMVANAAEVAATNLGAIRAWHTLGAAAQASVATAAACFALEYARPGRWPSRRVLHLLIALAGLYVAVLLSNDFHHFLWRLRIVNGTAVPQLAPGGWVAVGYVVVLAIIQVVALSWLFVRSPQHRWPVALMLATLFITRFVLILELTLPIAAGANIDVLLVLVTTAIYAVALFGFHIIDPLPAARQTLVEQMRAGVVVFDTRWRVASLNPAAVRLLGVRSSDARGRTWQELAPPGQLLLALPTMGAQPAGLDVETGAVTIGSGPQARHYAPALSQLLDARGLAVGYLLVLRDVTKQMQAQTQILEQERALAMLRERERLARELHDGVAQMLAAAHMQAATAKMLAVEGRRDQLTACLDDLADMTLQAEVDVREYLLGVKTSSVDERALFPALRAYIARFTQQYQLPVALTVPPELEAQWLSPTVELQILRIVQEALTNVRKHTSVLRTANGGSTAYRAQVSFTRVGAQVRIAISDDGSGFDPARVPSTDDHYGLRGMEQRAAAIGGRLEVVSSVGHGAQVILLVPWEEGRTASVPRSIAG